MDLVFDVLKDSVKDTLQLVPFLFLTYLAMEALEHGSLGHVERLITRAGKAGPAIGAVLGALPQCGFSAMAATLYAGRVVTVGTLVAVILSTSDELVPVLVAHQEPASRLFAILGIKVAVGLVVGFAVDAVVRLLHWEGDGKPHIHELCERSHCGCDDVDGLEPEGGAGAGEKEPGGGAGADEKEPGGVGSPRPSHHDHAGHAHAGHAHAGHAHVGHAAHAHHAHAHGASRGGLPLIVRSAFVHTVEVTVFIFLITMAFGFLIELVGQEELGVFLGIHPVRATLVAALIGLIPNCGASVAITELYLAGTLAPGPMIAGLLVSGGVGLLVLFRTNADLRQNLRITAFVYVVGVVVGLAVGALGIII